MSKAETWKSFTRAMIDSIAPKRTDVARLLNVAESELCRWCNPDNSTFMPLDHLIDANELSHDAFLNELARARGYELVPIEKRESNVRRLPSLAADLTLCAADLTATIHEALADNELTPNEAREVRRKINHTALKLNDVHGSL